MFSIWAAITSTAVRMLPFLFNRKAQKNDNKPPKKVKKRRKNFKKLTREDVNDSICQLENQLKNNELELDTYQPKIDELMQKGKIEKSNDMKILYAKRINQLKDERKQKINQTMYLMYNIRLLERLKKAVDENEFYSANSSIPINQLLSDQKALAKFLNASLGRRIQQEEIMTNADEIFQEVEAQYIGNEDIYGSSEQDNSLLAMFEENEQVEAEEHVFSEKKDSKETDIEKK